MVDINIIPIGSNCKISHYLRRCKLRHNAYPFDWNCTSLKMIYDVFSNDFENFLDDIFIGTEINRLYFGDDDDKLIISNEKIFPIICKKYNILFPHDFNKIDANYINQIKNKYKRRIERFRNIINSDKIIYLVYCNANFNLNQWQVSVYNEYNKEILKHYRGNNIYFLNKIKELFKDKKNINIISLSELKVMNL